MSDDRPTYASNSERLKAVEEFVKALTARLEQKEAWLTTLAEGLESLEKRFDQIVKKLGEVDEVIGFNGSDHEERLERLERREHEPLDPVMRRRELVLHMALHHLTGSGSSDDVVSDAHAYRRFLEGVDPPRDPK